MRRRPPGSSVGYYKRYVALGASKRVGRGRTREPRLWRFVPSRIVSNTLFFTSTALPRVGVARPNGSYVARTHLVCWTRDSLSSWTGKAAESSRLPNAFTPRIRVAEERSRNSSLFPLALYAVAKVKLRVPLKTHAIDKNLSSTSKQSASSI